MAYENYRFVSWAAKTPLTGDRLAQMSTNIEQVKLATDDRPQGVIKYISNTDIGSSFSDFTEHQLAVLDYSGLTDYRISADGNRFVRLTVSFPGVKVAARGAEDCRYELKIKQGDVSPSVLGTFYLNSHLFSFYDVSANASTTTIDVRSTAYPVYFGAGVYSIIATTSGGGWSNETFSVSIERKQNANTNNAPSYTIMSSTTAPVELYAEDVGGF